MTFNIAHKRRDWLAWLLIGILLYGTVCLLNLATDIGRPFPGFFTYFNLTLGRVEIVRNTPAWWWGLTDTEPSITDVLVQVEDTPFSNLTSPIDERIVYQKARDAGQKTVTVIVQRDGKQLALHVPLVPFSWRQYFDFVFAPTVISATLLMLAWLLYRASATDPTQRVVVALLGLMAIQPIGGHPSLFHYDQPLDRILAVGNITTTIGGLALGVMFYQFALRFPYPLTNRLTQAGTWVLSALALSGIFIFIADRVIVYTVGFTPISRRLDQVYFILLIGLILLGVLAVMIRMAADSFFPGKQRRHQREAQILLLALLLMLPTVWLIGHYLGGSGQSLSSLRLLADSRFFPLVLPLAFAAISLRYHTFSGAQNWFFLALLLAGSGFLANLGTALLFWDRLPLIRETIVPPTPILFLLLCALGLVWGWQASWRGWLGRVFQWERVSYHIVQQVGQQLLDFHDQEIELTQALSTTLEKALQVERTAVWVWEAGQFILTAQTGSWPIPAPVTLSQPSRIVTQPLRNESISRLWPGLFRTPITAIVPLTYADNPLGLIAIGPRWDMAVFDDRDLEIFALLGQQAALFLQNNRQSARLREIDRQLLVTLTHAHQKTAQDLHDHLLPTLSQLQLRLLAAANLINKQPDLALQTITDSQQDLAASTVLVRRIQQGLVVRPLEYGLRSYLTDMAQKFSQETGILIEQTLPADLDTRLQNLLIREVLYAIWQQSLDNVQRHAQATQVIISLTLSENQVAFSICDNGQGSSAAERQQALQNGRFGLRSMQIRLETIGGKLEIQSDSGQGYCLLGKFPLPENI